VPLNFLRLGLFVMLRLDSIKYPSEIIDGVKRTLKEELISADLNSKIEEMTKVEVMGKYFDSYVGKIRSSEVCRVVNQIFGIDLQVASPNISVIDSYLDHYGKKITVVEICGIINQNFGINLAGIDALEEERISVYSKNQWIIKNDKDLFSVHTEPGDVDVMVFPTDYFTKRTGIEGLPNVLKHPLKNLGFSYNEKIGSSYFSNPTGEAISDAFKGQTLKAIVEAIHKSYSHL
jgi:hypothetical protein